MRVERGCFVEKPIGRPGFGFSCRRMTLGVAGERRLAGNVSWHVGCCGSPSTGGPPMHRIHWNVHASSAPDAVGSTFLAQGLWPAPPCLREALGLFGVALAPEQALALTTAGPRPLVPSVPL